MSRIYACIFFVIAVSSMAVAQESDSSQGFVASFLETLQNFGPLGLVLLAAAYIIAAVALIPGSALTLGAGFLAAALFPERPLLAVFAGYLAAGAGSVTGAAASFLLGRTLLRGWISKKLAGNAKFDALDKAIGKEGFKVVLLVRLSPVFPFNVLNYALGLTQVKLRDYVLASAIGMLPATVLYVYIGTTLHSVAAVVSGQTEGGLAGQALLWVGLAVTVALVVYVTRVAKRALDAVETSAGEEQDD